MLGSGEGPGACGFAERPSVAEEYDTLGRSDRAAGLRAEAKALTGLF